MRKTAVWLVVVATGAILPAVDVAYDTFSGYVLNEKIVPDSNPALHNKVPQPLGVDGWRRINDAGTGAARVVDSKDPNFGQVLQMTAGQIFVCVSQTLGQDITGGKVRMSADVRLPDKWYWTKARGALVDMGTTRFASTLHKDFSSNRIGPVGVGGTSDNEFVPRYTARGGTQRAADVNCASQSWYRLVQTADLYEQTYDFAIYPVVGGKARETPLFAAKGVPFANEVRSIGSFALLAYAPGWKALGEATLFDNVKVWKDVGTKDEALVYSNDFATRTRLPAVATAACLDAELSADFAAEKGRVRRELHSSGYAPMIAGFGNLQAEIKSLNFHSVRTHDLALVNAGQRVVDAHFIFPIQHLDATNPSNYYFKATDYLLELSRNIGLDIFYRLGTSIEHSGRVHFNAQIPPDIDKMVETFAGTVRHYNRGWADGKEWGIKYWEIWNEPNLDGAMWCFSGTNDAKTAAIRQKLFVELYVKSIKRLKGEFPEIKVGGPALCWLDIPYLKALFKGCKEAGVAPDFISWHYYGSDPNAIIGQAETARKLCDAYGFTDCELINDEWHFIGKGGFGELRSNDPVIRKRVWEGPQSHNGIDSSCFTLTVLARLQTSLYSQAFFYGCRHTGAWGYMDEWRNKYKVWHALKAFGEIMKNCATLCESTRAGTVTTLAAKTADGKTGYLLVSDYCGKGNEIVVDVKNAGLIVSAKVLDHERNFVPAHMTIKDGRLTLKKEMDGSAAFLVTFDLP